MDSIKIVERRKFNVDERKIILAKTNGVCAHCGCGLDTASMTVEHIFPRAQGGLHDEYNLVPLCMDCNEEKSNYVYAINDYYKYIREDELEKFHMYNNFATFEYTRKSILGYDEKVFSFLSDKGQDMIEQMVRRKTHPKKIANVYNQLKIKVMLRRAYPASAQAIYELIEKCNHDKRYIINETIYKSEYDVLKAIEKGVVYILEKNKHICGVFIYTPFNYIANELDVMPIQLQNIIEQTNLQLKYVMTYATVTDFAYYAFSNIMETLDRNQIANGWMPVYFNMLDKIYRDSDKCIKIPHKFKDIEGFFEFMPISQLIDKQDELCRDIFDDNGYKDVDDFEIRQFSEYLIKYQYQKDMEGDDEAQAFFVKYPELKSFFKPESYEYYDVGFLTKIE